MKSKNLEGLHKVVIPIIRRVHPSLIAEELVGVQPMSGPFDPKQEIWNTVHEIEEENAVKQRRNRTHRGF